MRRHQNPPGLAKKSKRKEKLAASLRENLLRRKSQVRARRAGAAADKEAKVDLEGEAIVPDTGTVTGADR